MYDNFDMIVQQVAASWIYDGSLDRFLSARPYCQHAAPIVLDSRAKRTLVPFDKLK